MHARNVSPPSLRDAAASPASTLTIGDIYFILFRHKWRIVLCFLCGLAAAALYFQQTKPLYRSDASLYIRYVLESRNPSAGAGGVSREVSPDQRGETIIGTELQILKNLDLAAQVADIIGPDKILGKVGLPNARNLAAETVFKCLSVDVPDQGSVIHVAFSHPNPEIVQPALRAAIDQYLKNHVAVHQAVGIVGESLAAETEQLRARLTETEEELRRVQNKAGVVSPEDARKAYSDQISRLREEIFAAEVDLGARSAALQELTGKAATSPEPTEQAVPLGDDVITEYGRVNSRLDLFRKTEQQLLTQFTPASARVKEVEEQISAAETEKRRLEKDHPALTSLRDIQPLQNRSSTTTLDVVAESARLKALQYKIKILKSQMEQVKVEISNLEKVEATISDLRRKKDLDEANYRYYSARVEAARIDEALGSGRVSNIGEIQSPSPPIRVKGERLKVMIGIVLGGLALGLGWAFAIEMFFDHTVRRPVEVERHLNVPLFLSIPELDKKTLRLLRDNASPKLLTGETAPSASGENSTAVAVPEEAHALQPFCETLRDRLIGYFENRGLTHKPKLVAVTGLGKDSGVTTIAGGLAQSLSETGEGNVLLVDMTAEQGSAQQFFKGKSVTGLDELLESNQRDPVQQNLYVVTEGSKSDRLSRNLPQRFSKLVPKLKASDFDYIIFDMPTVSQISVTPRLAGFMDMVLLVIESEKTDREIVERATALLAESKAHVGAVLNKTKSYVPRALHQDTLSDL